MTTFRDIVSNEEVGENGQLDQPAIELDDNMPVDAASMALTNQALVPYDPANSVIWLDSPPIAVAAPGFRNLTRTNWTARLVGTGMVAATVASGMLLADSLHHQTPTEKKDNSLANAPSAKPKTAAGRLPQSPIATPESLPFDALAGDESAGGTLALKPGTLQSRLPRLLNQPSKVVAPLATVAVPGTPRFSVNANFKLGTPILRSVQELPAGTDQPIPSAPLAPPANVLSTLPPPPLVSPMTVASAATSPTAGLQADATPAPAVAPVTVAATPASGGAPQPASTTTPLPTTAPEEVQWVPTNPAKGSDQPSGPVQPGAPVGPSGAAPQEIVFSAPAPLATAARQIATTAATTAAAPQPTRLAAVPQSIQDFVQLRSTSVWLPLTQRAATEAQATNQVNQFRVFRINVKDYESIWRKSSQGLKELPPAHGFVDYSQQVIIVPQEAAAATKQPSAAPAAAQNSGNGLTPPAASLTIPGTRPGETMPTGRSTGDQS